MIKKILISGANGFIGSNLCNFLLLKGYSVTGLIRENANINNFNTSISIVRCDYQDTQKLKKLINDFDIFIHLAALTKAKDFEEFYQANVILTENLVRICSHSTNLKQFIFLSSQAAVGPSVELNSVKEDDSAMPISWYGMSKNFAEQKIINECTIPWTIIRPASVYGQGDRDFYHYFKMIKHHLAPIPGLETKYISLIFVQDLLRIIEKSINNNDVFNQILHAADEKKYTIEEFLSILGSVQNKITFSFKVSDKVIYFLACISELISKFTGEIQIFNKQKAIEIAQNSWLLDTQKTKILLNLNFNSNLYENLKKTFIWYKENNLL